MEIHDAWRVRKSEGSKLVYIELNYSTDESIGIPRKGIMELVCLFEVWGGAGREIYVNPALTTLNTNAT